MRTVPTLLALWLVCFLLATPLGIQAQPAPTASLSAAQLLQGIRKAQVLGSVLYIAAHPDDENTAFLAYMAQQRLYRTAYLSCTRGDGGQNLIGTEQGPLLGLIRTQELLAARSIDGAEQFFTRANDFGFSKGPEETFRIWNKDSILKDMVWVIRRFRPDVIVTRFPTNGDGGHGHHTASALLAEEAFTAAADPKRFPEQLSRVHPWQAKRILWNSWRFTNTGPTPVQMPGAVSIDLGTFNQLLGTSYTEVAATSRTQHKSQGFGSARRRGQRIDYYTPVAGLQATKDLTEGIDASWNRVPGGAAVLAALQQAEKSFQPQQPDTVLPLLLQAYRALDAVQDTSWRSLKRQEIQQLIAGCMGLWLEANPAAFTVAPGGQLAVTLSALCRSTALPVTLQSIKLNPSGVDTTLTAPLVPNQLFTLTRNLTVPPALPYSNPYWLSQPASRGLFTVWDANLIGLPVSPPALTAQLQLRVADVPLTYSLPLYYKWTDPEAGELYRQVEVSPPVLVSLNEKVYASTGNSKTVVVRLTAVAGQQQGQLQLAVPAGWQVAPAQAAFNLPTPDAEQFISFTLTPGAAASSGKVRPVATVGGKSYSLARTRISYPHIPIQTLFSVAEASLLRLNLTTAAHRVGYIMGAGDEVPASLEQLGVDVDLLEAAHLGSRNLAEFDAILTGVRAFNTEPGLKAALPYLLAYVQQGGTLVVQYNTERDLVVDSLGPYPFKITRDRVTDEEAAVKFLLPNHSLLTTPNKITPADFEGWVQERGLYFAGNWDSRYQTPLSMTDAQEPPTGGSLLYAAYGKGIFIYTGLSFFRELPAGVPGAYRLFANLISAGKALPPKP